VFQPTLLENHAALITGGRTGSCRGNTLVVDGRVRLRPAGIPGES
jgi:hypothetical protein